MTVMNRQHPISKFIQDKISNLSDIPNKSAEDNTIVDGTTYDKKRIKRKTTTALAMLRKGIGLPPGSVPEIWDITLENLYLKPTDRCAGEFAVHHTLTLFALHQQGKDINKIPMYSTSKKDNFGCACRKLADLPDSNFDAVRNRFNILVKSQTLDKFVYYLRGMIQLLKANDIQVNYAELGYSLFKFYFPANRDDVRLQWGEDFFASSYLQDASHLNESV